jgi:hypothetical protein
MLKILKDSIKKTPVYPLFQKYRTAREYHDSPNSLVYIHIGKCGGVTLSNAIDSSETLNKQFKKITKVHVFKPPILRKARYLVLVRNPVSRALSAFNWRYKLVVTDEEQKNRFSGEYEILQKYGTLNALAEQLYSHGTLNPEIAREFRTIHHLKEDIAYYLTELLDKIAPSQIYAVMSTESLDEDILTCLGVSATEKVHENASSTDSAKKYLSETARDNLRKFLIEDYRALEKLLAISHTTNASKDVLLK